MVGVAGEEVCGLAGGCAAVLAVNEKVPETEWPSADATRQATVWGPAGAPRLQHDDVSLPVVADRRLGATDRDYGGGW